MKFLPKLSSNEFTTIAFIVGLLLCDDLTPAEQNSIGNWFMLVGQVLATNASQQQVINNYYGVSNTSNQHVVGAENSVETLKRTVNSMNEKMKTL